MRFARCKRKNICERRQVNTYQYLSVMEFKNRVKETWNQMFREITVLDYVLFWVARILLLCAVVFAKDNAYRTLDSLNMLACYSVSIIRFIAPRKTFIARIDFRVQHIVNIFEVFGVFGGHLLDAYSYVPRFDRHLHWLSGYLVVVAGYYLYKAIRTKDGIEKYVPDPQIAALTSCGASFIIIVLWEISEFISDFFIGSHNQGYQYYPVDEELIFRFFGRGAGVEAQFPLFDTMCDMIDAAVTTVIATVILYFVLVRKNKKAAAKGQKTEECSVK